MFSLHMLFAAFFINISDVHNCFEVQKTEFSIDRFRFWVSFWFRLASFSEVGKTDEYFNESA